VLTSHGRGREPVEWGSTPSPPRRQPVMIPRPSRLFLIGVAGPWLWFVVRDLSPRLDLAALGIPPVAAVVVAACLLHAAFTRRPRWLIVVASWSLFVLAAVVGPWMPLGSDDIAGGLRLVAANVLVPQDTTPEVTDALLNADADVLVLSESSSRLQASLRPSYPFAIDNAFDGSVGVVSRFEMRELPLPEALAGMRARKVEVLAPSGPFVLYALHLWEPGIDTGPTVQGFTTQSRLISRLIESVERETLPVVVAGDLNLSDRTTGYRRLLGPLDDAARAGWSGPTSMRRFNRPFLLRIDHIFVSEQWCSADGGRLDVPTSDHRAVQATIGPCDGSRTGA
jgi:endonuclease/exonuclease/phosphatase (EEP) superfamily protein YafD